MTIPLPGHPVRGSRSGTPIMALFDLLGRRWSMGILWTLCRDGACTFRVLQERCEGVSPTVLNTRLKELRQAGLIAHDGQGYHALPLGQELYEVLGPLKHWARRWAAQMPPESPDLTE